MTLRVMEWINSRINFERMPAEQYELQDFKLERMQELLARLGNPQNAISAIHIAGTKGKGSTAAMAAAMLSATGQRVGLFTSPHLECIGERMTVNGQLPTDEQLDNLLQVVPPVVDELDALGSSMRPTFFECITAMAWEHFRRRQVEIAVLEVGLGGRLDATNVCRPLVTVITSISRDHERLLGSTLTAIASEKGGIIKPGVPVLSGVASAEPRDVIRRMAGSNSSPLFEIDRDLFWSVAAGEDDLSSGQFGEMAGPLVPLTIATESPWGQHRLRLPLPGRHQARNALLAVSACDLVQRESGALDDRTFNSGLSRLEWPLRIEVLSRRPLVIVDAAHNDASIESLIETLSSAACANRLLIFATSKDKDAAGMLRRLNSAFDRVILTQFVGNPRSVPLETLQSIADQALTIPHHVAATPGEAWALARSQTTADGLICATGSFFLAAEMRSAICGSRVESC